MQGEGDGAVTELSEETVIEVSEVLTGPRFEDLVLDLRPDLDAPEHASPDAEGFADVARDVARDAVGETAAAAPGPLHGRVAVVTGGAGGIGREVALGLARAGARVCVLGRDLAQLRETVNLAGPGAAILFLQCDVGSLSEIEGVVDFIDRFDRPVDILVHAEGVQVRGGVAQGSVNDLDEQYLVNVRGPYLMSQRLLEQLRVSSGHVVFVTPSPVAGGVDFGQFGVIADAVGSLANTLRSEVEADGVRVTSIRPEARIDDHTAGAVVALGPADVAASVLYAVQVPERLEMTEIRLRPRSV